MPKLTFYRQLRMDGGIRTGIDVDEQVVYGLFEEGEADDDPRLCWFVDLRCEGALPRSAPAARKWLRRQGDVIRDGFARCAEEVRAGIDPDLYPVFWEDFRNAPESVQMKIVFSATRRSDAIGMAEVLREIGSNWDRIIRSLKPAEAAHY